MSDLDRYGLFALVVIILLIIFVTMTNDQLPEDDPETTVLSLEVESSPFSSDDGGGASGQGRQPPFDFNEPGVDYPQGENRPPDAADTTSAEDGSFFEHEVQRNDTLSSISKKFYGSTIHWKTIEKANPGIDPKKLKVGDVVRVPRKPDSIINPSSTVQSTGTERTHEVRKNDSLRKISRIYYGTESKWKTVLEANKDKISDPRRLAIGTVLVIPR